MIQVFWQKKIDMMQQPPLLLKYPTFNMQLCALTSNLLYASDLVFDNLLSSRFLIVAFEMCERITKQGSVLVWTKMFVEVVLVLILYFSFFFADKLVLQSPEDTKCQPQPQTRNSERTSYYFWLKSNCFAFFHKDRLDTTTSRCSWLASL